MCTVAAMVGEGCVNGARRTSRDIVIVASIAQPAPRWTLLERRLLATLARGCAVLFARSFDARGYPLRTALVGRRGAGRRA